MQWDPQGHTASGWVVWRRCYDTPRTTLPRPVEWLSSEISRIWILDAPMVCERLQTPFWISPGEMSHAAVYHEVHNKESKYGPDHEVHQESMLLHTAICPKTCKKLHFISGYFITFLILKKSEGDWKKILICKTNIRSMMTCTAPV